MLEFDVGFTTIGNFLCLRLEVGFVGLLLPNFLRKRILGLILLLLLVLLDCPLGISDWGLVSCTLQTDEHLFEALHDLFTRYIWVAEVLLQLGIKVLVVVVLRLDLFTDGFAGILKRGKGVLESHLLHLEVNVIMENF